MNNTSKLTEYIYSDAYLGWNLGYGHPAQARRARNTLDALHALSVPMTVVAPAAASRDDLLLVHDPVYVDRVLDGWCDEWFESGQRRDLAVVAATMYGGTIDAARRIITGETVRAFNPQGAKHHAHHDHSHGFCVFNDHAAAARLFVDAGMRVAYLDWDAHHGDGVEALTADMPDVLTASVHNRDIFPWSGDAHEPARNVWNYSLMAGADDAFLTAAVEAALVRIAEFRPDVILLAAGADGHRDDPLGGLSYTQEGVIAATSRVRRLADDLCGGRILAGGAGGYRPDDATPSMWVAACTVLSL